MALNRLPLFMAVAASTLLFGCGNGANFPSGGGANAAATPAPSPDPLELMDARVREEVTKQLRDGESARFRNVRRVPMIDGSDFSPKSGEPYDPVRFPLVYCGEVNAKNAFGAYAGFQEFAVMPLTQGAEGAVTISDPQLPGGGNVAYEAFCKREGRPGPGQSVEFGGADEAPPPS